MTQPLYQKIENELYGKIKSGEYPLNSQIPTENELAQQLGVSRPTIRQALDSLTRHGYLTRIKGKGTFVTEPKVLHDSCRFLMSYQTESQYKGVSLRTKVIENVIVHPPGHVAQSLDLLPSEKVIKLTRLRWLEDYHNGAPVVYTTVYVPQKLFPDMTEVDFTTRSFYDVLDEQGLGVRDNVKKLEIVPATAKLTDLLKTNRYEPLILLSALGRTAEQMPIEYSESYYPSSRNSFHIHVHR